MRFVVTVTLLVIASSTHAQPAPIVADRPGLADGSTTIHAGTTQVEAGISVQDHDGLSTTVPTLVRFGITDNLELRVESDVFSFSSETSDFAPLAIGVKFRLREQSFPIAVIASVQPPSGGAAFGARSLEGELRLVADLELGGNITVTPNVGITSVEDEGSSAVFAVSIERAAGHITLFIDFEVTSGADASAIADAGVAWLYGNDTQLDLAAGFGLTGEDYPAWFVAAGISRRF